jgi:shikimate dehydrogenase
MEVSGKTRIVGLIGYPIEHTLSPTIHNTAFSALTLSWVYLPFEVKPSYLKDALKGLSALGICGANITIPYKQKALELMDELSEEAKTIGAVNTVVVKEDKLFGENTDGRGFLMAVEEMGFSPDKKTCFVLGAGGAARAVSFSLASAGARVLIYNRTEDRAERLVADINRIYRGKAEMAKMDRIKDAELLVNATSLGMREGDPMPIDAELLHSKLFLYDLVYNRETELIKCAKEIVRKAERGISMLIYQAALAFSIWTGKTAPIKEMKMAVENVLK